LPSPPFYRILNHDENQTIRHDSGIRPRPIGRLGGNRPPEEFVTVFGDTLPEFDPHRSIYSTEAQIFTALYEGLFSYNPTTLEPLAAAASAWEKSKVG